MADVRTGKGLDIGTVNLVASEMNNEGQIVLRTERNCFIDIPAEDASTKNRLSQLKVPYVIQNNRTYVMGKTAFELANILNKNLRRPMKDGLISPRELEAVPIMMLLIDRVVGKPRIKDEPCFYTIPAEPIDSELNVAYHREVFNAAVSKLGYKPTAVVEGQCIVLSELSEEEFTGIGISCGGGMHNVSVSYKSLPCLAFSTSRAGDWIDANAARVLGLKPAKIAQIKEKGNVDLMAPKTREEEAIQIYYKELVSYTCKAIKERFERGENMPEFADPVSVILGGGTSMVKGYVELWRQALAHGSFPIPVKEVRHAEDPFNAVAKGALWAALSATS